jgi:hypothetical protein
VESGPDFITQPLQQGRVFFLPQLMTVCVMKFFPLASASMANNSLMVATMRVATASPGCSLAAS